MTKPPGTFLLLSPSSPPTFNYAPLIEKPHAVTHTPFTDHIVAVGIFTSVLNTVFVSVPVGEEQYQLAVNSILYNRYCSPLNMSLSDQPEGSDQNEKGLLLGLKTGTRFSLILFMMPQSNPHLSVCSFPPESMLCCLEIWRTCLDTVRLNFIYAPSQLSSSIYRMGLVTTPIDWRRGEDEMCDNVNVITFSDMILYFCALLYIWDCRHQI